MSLQTIKTIQSGIQTSYSDRYIKQALSNLGQRTGAKGDSITNKTFTIKDIAESDTLANLVSEYVCLKYDAVNNNMYFISDSNEVTDTNIIAQYSDTPAVNVSKIEILESLTTWNNYSDVNIIKNHNFVLDNETGSYFVMGLCKNNTVTESILSLNFSENNNVLSKAVLINKAGQDITYYVSSEDSDGIYIEDNKRYVISSVQDSLDTIYNLVRSCVSVESLIDTLKSLNGNNVTEVTLEEGEAENSLNIFGYATSVLPKYIKDEYNKAKYFSDNNYKTFKKAILYNFVKKLYLDSSVVNTTYYVYIPKDYVFSYICNSTTDAIYTSYDINVQFDINIDTDDLSDVQYILAESQSDTKVASYKFIVSYLESEELVDTIEISKNYTLPYIKSVNDITYWVIDDKITDVPTSGENAGNPNIMMISYSAVEIPGTVAYSDDNSIYINILHTYNETIGDTSYKELLEDSINTAEYSEFKYTTGVSTGSENVYDFRIKLPDVNHVIAENIMFERIVKNTLLMTFIDLKLESHSEDDTRLTLQEQLHGTSGSSSYITVYWNIAYNTNTGKYYWNPILNPMYSDVDTAPVLDLGAMLSMKDFIDYYSNTLYAPDKYLHRWIVFDEAAGILKNTPTGSNKKKIFPIIKNDPSSYYISDDTDNYTNNLNFVPKFLFDTYTSGSNVLDTILKDKNGIGITAIYDNQNYNNISNKMFSFGVNSQNQYKATKHVKINTIDYIPNSEETENFQYNYPMFDFREVFTINQTAMNRISFLMTEDDGTMYHAYLGYSGNGKRNKLTIGTDRTNYNMSTNITLTNTFENFKTLDTLDVAMQLVSSNEQIAENLVFNKCGDNSYYTIVTVSQTDQSAYIVDKKEGDTAVTVIIPKTPYMNAGDVGIAKKQFNAKSYVSQIYGVTSSNILTPNDVYCELFDNTGTEGDGLGPDKLSFILYFTKAVNANNVATMTLTGCNQIVTSDILAIY